MTHQLMEQLIRSLGQLLNREMVEWQSVFLLKTFIYFFLKDDYWRGSEEVLAEMDWARSY
jgi:hypothetical protein